MRHRPGRQPFARDVKRDIPRVVYPRALHADLADHLRPQMQRGVRVFPAVAMESGGKAELACLDYVERLEATVEGKSSQFELPGNGQAWLGFSKPGYRAMR